MNNWFILILSVYHIIYYYDIYYIKNYFTQFIKKLQQRLKLPYLYINTIKL